MQLLQRQLAKQTEWTNKTLEEQLPFEINEVAAEAVQSYRYIDIWNLMPCGISC